MYVAILLDIYEQTMWIYFSVIIVTYPIFHNKLCPYINEINRIEHQTNHNENTYEVKAFSG